MLVWTAKVLGPILSNLDLNYEMSYAVHWRPSDLWLPSCQGLL